MFTILSRYFYTRMRSHSWAKITLTTMLSIASSTVPWLEFYTTMRYIVRLWMLEIGKIVNIARMRLLVYKRMRWWHVWKRELGISKNSSVPSWVCHLGRDLHQLAIWQGCKPWMSQACEPAIRDLQELAMDGKVLRAILAQDCYGILV